SDQRSRFVTALQTEVRKLGEDKPEDDSSATGALHCGWINLKAAVTGGDEDAILDECERREESAVEAFHKAPADELHLALQGLVVRGFCQVGVAAMANHRGKGKRAVGQIA